MSPLLFVMGVKYLSRSMKKVGSLDKFRFHENCKILNLNHLSFADDVLLFFHGDYQSSYLMLLDMLLFSKTSGLYPNKNKSEIYWSGMKETDFLRVVSISNTLACLSTLKDIS
ncbi:unnamed protein product [Vicia faba]|uniref:Reverse transcriptase domain-containing protein n=1 Tax=Vicia faba TaxID=3906 RepID=A0AAV0Z6L2_VICFA|nr:unnamed protein product [Vicia faba]